MKRHKSGKPEGIEKSCGVILFKRGKKTLFLLLRYLPGHWGFARGHSEEGETEKETAIREVKEETGIKSIRLLKGFREGVQFSFRRKGKNVQKQVVFFLGEAPKRAVKLSGEHLEYIWLTYREAMNKLTYGNARRILKRAGDFLNINHRTIVKPKVHPPKRSNKIPTPHVFKPMWDPEVS